jgi:hypothetical protein
MKSDKQQMTYVPQVTEHVVFTSVDAGTCEEVDMRVPIGAIIEKMVVTVKTQFSAAVVLNVGSTDDEDKLTPTAISLDTAPVGEQNPQVWYVPISSFPDDRIIRFKADNATASNGIGEVYAYIQYRFAANTLPSRIV